MLLFTFFQIWNVQKRKNQPLKELSITFFHFKTDYLHLKTDCNDERACLRKQLKWNQFLFYGDKLSGKVIHAINIADSVSEKITYKEQSPLIRRQVVWRNYSEQLTEKQNSVKTCTKSPKRIHFHIWKSL